MSNDRHILKLVPAENLVKKGLAINRQDTFYTFDILPTLKDGDSSCETRMSARENDVCRIDVALMLRATV